VRARSIVQRARSAVLARLKWDGSTFQLRVREPPADGRANTSVIRAVARWAGIAPSQVAIVSGTTARRKLAGIDHEDRLPHRLSDRLSGPVAITVSARGDRHWRAGGGASRRNRGASRHAAG